MLILYLRLIFFCAIITAVNGNASSEDCSGTPKDPPEYQYHLAVVAIFKDCAPFLKEWIEYHRLVGIDHFYLYDNESTDHPQEILSDYINSGLITYTYWPDQKKENWQGRYAWVYTTQLTAYDNALLLAKEQCKWLAIIDSDEFLVPMIDANLPEFINRYPNVPGFHIHWQCYGTSNVYDIPPNSLMTELLTLKANEEHYMNNHTKVICNPRLFGGWIWIVHSIRYLDGRSPYTPPVCELRINHYFNRTIRFFLEHKIRGKNHMDNNSHSQEQIQNWLHMGNEKEDRAIDRFLPLLRARLFPKNLF